MTAATHRFWWGEVTLSWGLGLSYQPRAHFHVHLGFGSFYINVPRRDRDQDWDAPKYGFSLAWRTVHLHWGRRVKIVHLPWEWTVVRWSVLRPDGTRWKDDARPPNRRELPAALFERHQFRYLMDAEVQQCEAKVSGEEVECRWRCLKWWPFWPRRVERSIWVEFSEEMGPGRGSWKGGTCATGHDWREGERLVDALRRMEREVRFSR